MKDASSAALGKQSEMRIIDGVFTDSRWVDGRWDTAQFKGADGEVDWDKVGQLYCFGIMGKLVSSIQSLIIFGCR